MRMILRPDDEVKTFSLLFIRGVKQDQVEFLLNCLDIGALWWPKYKLHQG